MEHIEHIFKSGNITAKVIQDEDPPSPRRYENIGMIVTVQCDSNTDY